MVNGNQLFDCKHVGVRPVVPNFCVSVTSYSDVRLWLRSTGTENLHGPSSIAVRLHFCFHQEPCLI